MERFKNAIFKQRKEINDRMTKMFGLLKELTTSKTPEKVLIREKAKFSVTKNVNSISLARGKEERSDKTDETLDNTVKPTVTKTKIPVKEAKRNNETKNKPIKKAKKKEVKEVLSSRPVEYYLKHRINEKLIEGLVDNNRFSDSLSRAQVGKEDVGGNFKIPCRVRGLKHVNALIDQGSDVNVMPYTTYIKLTDEMPVKTDIRLLLASHSYIYPLGIVEDILVEVAEHVYLVDFVILDIKENKKRPFILGTLFLTTAKVTIKFDKGPISLRSRTKNGNSSNPVPRITANADGTSTLTISGLITTEEKTQKKNDVKDRSMLLMALPNEHLLTFSQYKDAKTLFEAIQARFGGYDKTKVESFNCHKMRHFAKECRSPKNQESRPRNQDNSRKTVIVEYTSSKAMVAIDGVGFDWSYMGDDEVTTNMALMDFSDSKVKSVNTVNTAKGKNVTSAIGKQGSNAVKSSACWVWRPKIKVQDHVSKNSGSYICKRFDYVDLEDYLEYDRGFVAFADSSK
nr:hypothetical protein [Tanacetum cinerariifolium]